MDSSKEEVSETIVKPQPPNDDVVSRPNDDVTSNDTTDDNNVIERRGDSERTAMAKNTSDGPPVDDCCPICFGSFSVACRANCGHWYCGGCILQYWNYSAASRPCKCPMCSSSITKLMPEASLLNQQEQEVRKVLENVQRYNCLFVGGARGFVRKLLESPLFAKRIFLRIMDPDGPDYLHEMRFIATILSVLYACTPLNFIPTGRLGIVRVFDYATITLYLVLRMVGLFRRYRLQQRVRHLAATQTFGE